MAFRNHEAALANIHSKIAILTALTKPWGSGALLGVDDARRRDEILPLLPRSVRQFNSWHVAEASTLSHLGFPNARANAHQTLSANPEVLALVRECVSVVTSLGKAGPTGDAKQSSIAALNRRAALANSLRTIAERELVAAKRARQDLALEVAALTARINALERESQEAIKRLTAELKAAKARVRPALKSV